MLYKFKLIKGRFNSKYNLQVLLSQCQEMHFNFGRSKNKYIVIINVRLTSIGFQKHVLKKRI